MTSKWKTGGVSKDANVSWNTVQAGGHDPRMCTGFIVCVVALQQQVHHDHRECLLGHGHTTMALRLLHKGEQRLRNSKICPSARRWSSPVADERRLTRRISLSVRRSHRLSGPQEDGDQEKVLKESREAAREEALFPSHPLLAIGFGQAPHGNPANETVRCPALSSLGDHP